MSTAGVEPCGSQAQELTFPLVTRAQDTATIASLDAVSDFIKDGRSIRQDLCVRPGFDWIPGGNPILDHKKPLLVGTVP
jgi:hypothetical protein